MPSTTSKAAETSISLSLLLLEAVLVTMRFEGITPVQVFEYFFDNEFFRKAQMTLYAIQQRRDPPNPSTEDPKAMMAIIYFSGYHEIPITRSSCTR